MHILFLTDNFPPEVNAPASRTFEHCREWVGAGHQVTVVTCAPNFPKGQVFAGYMVSAILASPLVRKVDVVVATSPQIFTACASWIVSVVKRKPFVFELR